MSARGRELDTFMTVTRDVEVLRGVDAVVSDSVPSNNKYTWSCTPKCCWTQLEPALTWSVRAIAHV